MITSGWPRRTGLVALGALLVVACGCSGNGGGHAIGTASPSTTGDLASTGTSATAAPPSTDSYDNPVAPPGAELTLDPAEPTVGHPASVAVRGCPVGNTIRVRFVVPVGPGGGSAGPTSVVSSDPMTLHYTFPDGAVGPVDAVVQCLEATSDHVVFDYPVQKIVVTTDRRLRVEPATPVAVGATIAITPQGPACAVHTTVSVGLEVPAGVTPVHGQVSDPSSGRWSAQLTVPATLAPGTYQLDASCYDGRSLVGVYTPVTIEVTAG